MRRTDCSSLTSTASAIVASPSSLAAADARSPSMSAMTTLAPSDTMRRAVANPRPDAAPVTMATRSCREASAVMSEDPQWSNRTTGATRNRQRRNHQTADRRAICCSGPRCGTELAVVDEQQADRPDQSMHAHEWLRRMIRIEEVPAQHRHLVVGDPLCGGASDARHDVTLAQAVERVAFVLVAITAHVEQQRVAPFERDAGLA